MTLLTISDLTVSFPEAGRRVEAVRGVSFALGPGESLGIVGESGSGKSVTCMAALRLLRQPPARIAARELRLGETDMLSAGAAALSRVRGGVAAMVFQDPMTAFDPVYTIGRQIAETIRAHRATPRAQAMAEAVGLLARVEIRAPDTVAASYPHQLSGGMLQRAMIAMALSCQPRLLIADEPTTALDVTVQAQILSLIKGLQAERAMGLIMVTHDLGVVAETCDRVVVMYGGQVMEEAPVAAIFDDPRHPYTAALIAAIPGRAPPVIGPKGTKAPLAEIPGAAPDPSRPLPGCPFAPRCPQAGLDCAEGPVPMIVLPGGRRAACRRLA